MSFTLKEVRKKIGLSREDVAKKSGISLAGVFSLEENKTVPTQATCKKLVKAYGISAYILRTIALLSIEELPKPGKNKERFLEMQRLCIEAVDDRVNGKNKKDE